MVRDLVRLKLRLTWNGVRSDAQRRIGLPLILGLVVYVTWLLTTGHLAALDRLAPTALGEYLAWASLVAFIAWVALPVVIFPLDENLDPQQLGSLPISRPRLSMGLVAAALVAPSVIAPLALLAGTAAHRPGALVVTVPAMLVMMVMLVVGSQGFTTVVSAVLHSRRGRDLAVMLIMGIGLSAFAGYQTVRNRVAELGLEAAVRSHPIDHLWALIPPLAPAHAVSAAWDGRWPAAIAALVVAAAWTVALALGWERVLRRLLVTPRQQSLGRSTVRRQGLAAGPWGTSLVMARKELRFYARDPRLRLVWTGTVIFVGLAVAALVVGSEGFAQLRTQEWLPLLAPGLVLMVGLPIALNQFGWERNAASYLFVLPAKARAVIVGKNLAALVGLGGEAVFLGVLFAWFSSSWQWMALLPALTLGAVGCLLAVGNLVSVLAPLRLPRQGTDVFAQATEQGLLALISQVVAFCAIGLLMVLPASVTVLTVGFGQAIAPWFAAVFAIGWGLVWYLGSLWLAGRLLSRRVPEVVSWVQVA